jgi:hypothetical protein
VGRSKGIGTKSLKALTHTDSEAYRAAIQARDLWLTPIGKRLIHVRHLLEEAVRFGHTVTNP